MTRFPLPRRSPAVTATLLAAFLCAAAPLRAQIGTTPEQSPFRDLPDHQRFGVVVGYLSLPRDPVDVAPASGPVFGLRYDVHGEGPAYFTMRLIGGNSDRNVVDPTRTAADRVIGKQSVTMVNFDLGLTLGLTGHRTWRGIQPLMRAGVGAATAFGDQTDASGYKTNSSFTLGYGLGVRYATSRMSHLRLDLDWHYLQLKYPSTYRPSDTNSNAPRPTGTLSPWLRGRTVALGWIWDVFR